MLLVTGLSGEHLPIILYVPFLAVPILALWLFGHCIKERNGLLEEELGKQPLYREYCGARFGRGNLSIPFVRLCLYDNFMVIRHAALTGGLDFGPEYRKAGKTVLLFRDIRGVSTRRMVLSQGILIDHCRDDVPKPFILWSRHPKKLKQTIEKVLAGGRP